MGGLIVLRALAIVPAQAPGEVKLSQLGLTYKLTEFYRIDEAPVSTALGIIQAETLEQQSSCTASVRCCTVYLVTLSIESAMQHVHVWCIADCTKTAAETCHACLVCKAGINSFTANHAILLGLSSYVWHVIRLLD